MRGETQVMSHATLVFQPRRNDGATVLAAMAASGDGLFGQRMRKLVVEQDMHRAHRRALLDVANAAASSDRLAKTAALVIQENAEELYAPLHSVPSSAGELALHYAFPPYSTGEVGRVGTAGRRELGHGNLAERALASLMPVPYAVDARLLQAKQHASGKHGNVDAPVPSPHFPFAARVSTTVVSSNGSSSMAAVCAGSLALADAGVPMPTGHCAGISIGLVMEEEEDEEDEEDELETASGGAEDEDEGGSPDVGDDEAAPMSYQVLVDIQGLEDGMGDMDFKVAGTASGITAIQLDVKPRTGVPVSILREALLHHARPTLNTILAAMNAACEPAKDAMSAQERRKPDAPLAGSVTIPRTAVPRLVGPGGSRARLIEANAAERDNPWSLKHAAGGLIEIEFLAQTGALLHGLKDARRPAVALPALVDAGWLSPDAAETLAQTARLLSALQQVERVALEGAMAPEAAGPELRQVLARAAEVADFDQLSQRLSTAIKETAGIVSDVFDLPD